jgi:hypothetical protein
MIYFLDKRFFFTVHDTERGVDVGNVFCVQPAAGLWDGRRAFIPGRKIFEGVIFVIINN